MRCGCGSRRSSRALPVAASSPRTDWAATALVVERTLSWLNRFRCLKIRDEHRADIHLAFLQRRLAPSSPWVSSANTLVAVLSSDSTCLDFSGSLVIGEDHTV
jgi:hypothetical protein